MLRSHLETIKRTASSFRNTLKYVEIIHWSTSKCICYNAEVHVHRLRHKAFQIFPNISKPCTFDYVLYSIIIGTDSTCVPNFKSHEAMTSAGGPISTMQPSSKRRRRSKCCKRDFSGCVTTMRVLDFEGRIFGQKWASWRQCSTNVQNQRRGYSRVSPVSQLAVKSPTPHHRTQDQPGMKSVLVTLSEGYF